MRYNIWLYLGIFLLFLEFIIPGAVLSFVGTSSLIVAFLIYLNLIDTFAVEFFTFFFISIIMLFFVRSILLKYLPGGESVDQVDSDLSAINEIVEVVETTSNNKPGRIKFRDTYWDARSRIEINKGKSAYIHGKQDNIWYISETKK